MILVAAPAPDDALVGLLAAWLPRRRWYPAKDAGGRLDLVGILTFPADPDGRRVRVALVRVQAPDLDVDAVLQVPLVLGDGTGDVLGELDGVAVRDGAGDPDFVAAWLGAADGPLHRGGVEVDPASARVVTGEQSNTSVILAARPGGEPVGILKVLRTVAAGGNPDVDVPRRLVEVGWDGVPAPLGWLSGRWPDGSGTAEGHLGVLSAFVPDAQDGFRLACDYARRGEAFDELAAALGRTVADLHVALVAGFGTVEDGEGTAGVSRFVADRFAWAADQVDELAACRAGVARVVDELRALTGVPPRQRVHGDLHLGQVLRSSGRWYVTDFEGEPLAPLAERTRPDYAVRDVAGLLRSFDYAAAVGGLRGAAAAAWVSSARLAALRAYDEDAGTTLAAGAGAAAGLLRAFEIDKAAYEAVYERRNRPDWLPIPLEGLARLLP